MNIAIFDTYSGLSGDMMIGALISAGMPLEYLQKELKKLDIRHYSISQTLIQKKSITAVKFNVHIEHVHNNSDNDSEHHSHGRSYKKIISLIDASELSQGVKDRAKKIFKIIGEAEAKIHNVMLDDVHFHEIGAIDSIVDIVGCAIGFEYFNIRKVYTTTIPLGRGFVETQHGRMPIPAPATMEILRDYPVVFLDIPFELTTPTGAGIIKAESSGELLNKKFIVNKIGYGAGAQEIRDFPNIFRLMIGEIAESYFYDETLIIETNIDDMNPEFYPYVVEKLLDAGALDAYLVPIIMKKGRPGILLSTLVDSNLIDDILEIIYRETTTLGIRILRVERRKLLRDFAEVETKFGKVKVKVVNIEMGKRFIPEFEECKKIATERNIPISEVYNEILKLNR